MHWARKKAISLTLALLTLGGWHFTRAVEAPPLPLELPPEGIEFFEKKIRPILVERCYLCHSSQSPQLQGSLLLDSRDGLLKGGKSGPTLVPGEPDESLLIRVLRYNEKDLKMPPGEKLAAEVIA